jgi:hypothetical protein
MLEIIVPFAEYGLTFAAGRNRSEYERHGTNDEAYLASGKTMVERSDLLIAVWNGKPAAGLGGTGDIVKYAVRQHKRTIHVNPISYSVSEL